MTRDVLHPLLHNSVCESFTVGNYDIAVRDAFLIVEDRVRIASGIKEYFGIKLMRAAFSPNGGSQTLTDMSLPAAERERVADMFVGAIATFKDPVSQGVLSNSGPAPVIKVLMFASELLCYLP
jgi:uncharacterized protein (TIGR02391 family)